MPEDTSIHDNPKRRRVGNGKKEEAMRAELQARAEAASPPSAAAREGIRRVMQAAAERRAIEARMESMRRTEPPDA